MNELMKNKRGLVMGIANDRSIAWGIARKLAEHGAELAITYQNEAFARRVRPLAEKLGATLILLCDVEDPSTIDACFQAIGERWGKIDFVVHSIGYSDRSELRGRYADVTTRENFVRTMLVSAYSFTEVAQRAAKLMMPGGVLLTLTYGGSVRAIPNYNVMGVAKAALEAMVRYLAVDFGPDGIRVNAISAGPVRTMAGMGIGDARTILGYLEKSAPLRRAVDIDEIGSSALYLLSDFSRAVTGEIHYVDCGFNITAMPPVEESRGPHAGDFDAIRATLGPVDTCRSRTVAQATAVMARKLRAVFS